MQLKIEDIMPNNSFITKMTEKRRRRKAMKKAAKASSYRDEHSESSNGGDRRVRFGRDSVAVIENPPVHTESGDRRVRFGRDSVAVYELPPVHTESEHEQEHQEEQDIRTSRKEQLWYDKKELNEQFLLDLQAHVQDQIIKAQPNYQNTDNAIDTADGRGLEFHFAHNQRRKERAEAYVAHIVEKAQTVRKEVGLLTPLNTTGNRKWDRRMAVRSLTKNTPAAQQYSDQIQEYCSQLTWMSRDLAIGVAVQDAAEARAVYEEEEEVHAESDSDSDSDCTTVTCDKSTTSSDFVHTSHNCQAKRPVSYNAKSA